MDKCSFLECCFDEDPSNLTGKVRVVTIMLRTPRLRCVLQCILKDWVVPSAAALCLALLLSCSICCCCCCCSKKNNRNYSLH